MTRNATNSFFVGYRQLSEEEVDRYSQDNPPPRPYPHESQINVTAHLRAFVSSCNHMEADSNAWSKSGCKVTRETTVAVVVCECNHLTTFAAGFNSLVAVQSLPPFHLSSEQPQPHLNNPCAYALLIALLSFLLRLTSGSLRTFWMSALLILATAFLLVIA
ncbi:Polycystic kidney disease protein 1-like 3 [Taenia solium]|eukprot:TsM_000742700 transcript=TsM_000742700 gene=TsM_000742700